MISPDALRCMYCLACHVTPQEEVYVVEVEKEKKDKKKDDKKVGGVANTVWGRGGKQPAGWVTRKETDVRPCSTTVTVSLAKHTAS